MAQFMPCAVVLFRRGIELFVGVMFHLTQTQMSRPAIHACV